MNFGFAKQKIFIESEIFIIGTNGFSHLQYILFGVQKDIQVPEKAVGLKK